MNLSNFSEEPFCECIFSYSRLRIIDTFVGVVTISIAIVTGGTLDFTKQLEPMGKAIICLIQSFI